MLSEKEPLLSACYAASIRNYNALGDLAGKPLMRVFSGEVAEFDTYREERSVDGFNLHAFTAISTDDRQGLERILRYMGRPPISQERLSLTSDGSIIVRLKTPRADGTSHLVMAPLEFLSRLTSLIPPPRKNMIRCHGIFGANSGLRVQIVPKPNQETSEGQGTTEGNSCQGQGKRCLPAEALAKAWGPALSARFWNRRFGMPPRRI